jgi:hypothetical protein
MNTKINTKINEIVKIEMTRRRRVIFQLKYLGRR